MLELIVTTILFVILFYPFSWKIQSFNYRSLEFQEVNSDIWNWLTYFSYHTEGRNLYVQQSIASYLVYPEAMDQLRTRIAEWE